MLDLTTSFFLYLGLKGITYTTTKTDTIMQNEQPLLLRVYLQ